MVKIRKKLVLGAIISLILITGIAISFLPHTAKALPSTETNYQGYSGMFGEALHNYSQRTSYSSQQPQITFLVHGQGGTRSAWSNVNNKLDYDKLSIIEQICREVDASVYVASVQKVSTECMTNSQSHYLFTNEDGVAHYQCDVSCKRKVTLEKVEKYYDNISDGYRYTFKQVSNITDFGTHSIVIFEASQTTMPTSKVIIYGGDESNHDVAYGELELVIDSLLSDYNDKL